MSTYRLKNLLSPRSVALVDASSRPVSVGRDVIENIRKAEFEGPFGLVNTRHAEIGGVSAVSSLDQLPFSPELVVITAPAAEVPGIIDQAGRRGSAGALIVSAGLGQGQGSLHDAVITAARRIHSDSIYERGEYAILLRSDLKGRGLGWALMQLIIDYAKSEGLKAIFRDVLRENTTMLEMCRQLGFEAKPDPAEPDICEVRLRL